MPGWRLGRGKAGGLPDTAIIRNHNLEPCTYTRTIKIKLIKIRKNKDNKNNNPASF